jgi:TolB-like protein/Tfp pilus assembly protein PilF
MERRLAAILLTDMVGYSRLMGLDEEGTIARQKAHREEIIDPKISAHGGRIVKSTGDGVLVEFASVVDAVKCAVEVQQAMARSEADVPEDRRIHYRIGINLGDIVIDGDDILGDGVNVAARLEGLAKPGGICISGNVHDQLAGKTDFAFVDAGEQTVKNVPRPVRVWHWQADQAARGPKNVNEPLPLPDKPSIAVLPFVNMSSDAEQEYFADGIVEDVLTSLSQLSSLFVVARNSSFAFKDKNVDVREVARQLGVRYILEGSVRRSGDRLRVTAQLVDATNGSQLWAERYERQVSDVFDIQDELTKEIVTALRIQLTDGEQASMWLRSTNDFEAWGYATRGEDLLWRGRASDIAQARSFLEQAVACDPSYAKALALIGLTHYFDVRFNYSTSRDVSQRKIAEYASKTLQLVNDEPYGIWVRALLQSLNGNFQAPVLDMKSVVAKHPSHALFWFGLARLLINAGQPDEAEKAMRHAMRLNPLYPINYLAVLGDALVHQHRADEAIDVFKRLVERQPDYISAHLHLAALYGSMENFEAAKSEVSEVLRINPQYRVSAAASFYLTADQAAKDKFLSNLRVAGLPE